MAIELNLLPHQAEFIADSTTRNLCLLGGYGAGKTYSLAVKLITLSMMNPGHEGIALSPTYGMATRVLIPAIQEQLDIFGLSYNFSKSSLVFDIAIGKKPTRLHVMAAESYKRAAGINAAFFGIDEADLIETDNARAAWQMLSSRLRKGNVYQGVASSTPEGYNFLYKYFQEEVEQNPKLAESRRIIRGRTYDNPFLPKEYIEELERQYPDHLIKAYLNGEFVNLVGSTVYYCFDKDLNNTTKTAADFPNHALHIGIDFNVDKMSGIVSVVKDQMSYTVDELIGARNTEALIKEIKQRYPGRHIVAYPDSSGKNASANADISSIAMLQQAGFDCKFKSVNPRIANRVAAVNVRLKDVNGVRRAFVNTQRCPNLTQTLLQQAYDKSGTPDKSSGLDHAGDGYGYFLSYNWPVVTGGTYSVFG